MLELFLFFIPQKGKVLISFHTPRTLFKQESTPQRLLRQEQVCNLLDLNNCIFHSISLSFHTPSTPCYLSPQALKNFRKVSRTPSPKCRGQLEHGVLVVESDTPGNRASEIIDENLGIQALIPALQSQLDVFTKSLFIIGQYSQVWHLVPH